MGQFDSDVFDMSFGESIVLSIIWFLYIDLAVVLFTMHQGVNVWYGWKFVAIILFNVFNVGLLMQFYLNEKLDVLVPLLGDYSNQISLRSLLISKIFDLSVWWFWLAYNVYKEPNVINLTSKIKIQWDTT